MQLPKASAVADDIDSTTRCFTWERHHKEKYKIKHDIELNSDAVVVIRTTDQ